MKRKLFVLIALVTCCLMSGCSGGNGIGYDAAGYVKAVMDNIYYGDSEDYRRFVDISEEEAESEYESGLEVEADYFLWWLGLEYVSDKTMEQYRDLFRDIYQNAKYSVELVKQDENSYQVEVKVSPIDLFVKTREEVDHAIDTELDKTYDSDEEWDEAIAKSVYRILDQNKNEISYLEETSVIVTIAQGKNGLWSFDNEDFKNVDAAIIVYE